ncbi:MAG: dinitrogenase iron-molybdenum cofactor biosynthesis protein [Chloroflexi bacterium]|nr:MAG: dinitrogenase iron-molybdenum cofactor biosynthesis protein [Chloroflexota bacterium]
MKIVVTANGTGLDAPATPIFGRCPTYVFVDTETMAVESVDNPAMNAAGGAGIQAAQFVVERGARAVISGNMGPNAFNVLQSANVPIYLFGGGTVQQAVEAYKAGQLSTTGGASGPAHAGMGMGRGIGRRAAMPAAPSAAPTVSREEEIESLKDMAGGLRKQLAEVMERLDRLEKGE